MIWPAKCGGYAYLSTRKFAAAELACAMQWRGGLRDSDAGG